MIENAVILTPPPMDMPEEPNEITGQYTPAIHMPWYQRVPKWLQQEVTG